MRIDGFYVVGRETPGEDAVFMRMYWVGGDPVRHWGELQLADRYLLRVEVTATKEDHSNEN